MLRLVRAVAFSAAALLAWAAWPIGAASFAQPLSTVTFEDRNGVALGVVQGSETERRIPVGLPAISPRFLAAVVATEDGRFFAHDGVDALAFARAVLQSVRAGHVVSGGSTITMQLARLRFGVPRTPLGKLEEIVLALRIEAGMSKPAIVAAYANEVPLGGELVGVEAASRAYFGVPARELDLAQAALLAALPNDPVRLDPYLHRQALEARRRFVLARMRAAGLADPDEVARAASERVAVQPPRDGIVAAPHLLLRLANRAALRGARVRTTLDRDLQQFVENAVVQVVTGLTARGARDGAALVVNNRDGAIVAYAGSAGYFARSGRGKNDGVVALRQPGSTLKPFLYELALERRAVRPTSILADVPAAYALPGNRSYAPSDYNATFAGPVRMRVALADSLNVPAVRLLANVGVPAFLERLHALGFRHLTQSPEHYGLGLALGDGEVTLEELAGAYATLARGGERVHVHAFAPAR
ncbi:MAG: transglycosylase domain-containing protein, partial [Candidatus Eremiobacteraeota bacterium]|nr:transglycosylase domain-containing protein [Candidatus Eremiobacteraeota bacterium]